MFLQSKDIENTNIRVFERPKKSIFIKNEFLKYIIKKDEYSQNLKQ